MLLAEFSNFGFFDVRIAFQVASAAPPGEASLIANFISKPRFSSTLGANALQWDRNLHFPFFCLAWWFGLERMTFAGAAGGPMPPPVFCLKTGI